MGWNLPEPGLKCRREWQYCGRCLIFNRHQALTKESNNNRSWIKVRLEVPRRKKKHYIYLSPYPVLKNRLTVLIQQQRLKVNTDSVASTLCINTVTFPVFTASYLIRLHALTTC